MTQKVSIVYNSFGAFLYPWLRPFLDAWFDFEPYQSDKTYSNRCLFYVDSSSEQLKTNKFYEGCLLSNRKVLYDNLFEIHYGSKGPGVFVLHNENWFWYNESILFKFYGYHNYTPNKNYQQLALMPLRRARPHRDRLLNKMNPWLDQCYWSYIEKGRQLPGDRNAEEHDIQRDFHNFWYDDTCFSIVAETLVDETSEYQKVFLTEKTMKPLAYFHPFLLWGHPGSLQKLHSIGFETFENMFDESYDDEYNHDLRLDKIIGNVMNYTKNKYDTLTWEKLHHNHNLFFNTDLIKQKLFEEIIAPLLELAES